MQSIEMENISFHMFDDKTKIVKKFRKYIITTKKMSIRHVQEFVLRNYETIVYEQKNENRDF